MLYLIIMKWSLVHILACLIITLSASYAQKEANIWIFGDGIGINFNNDRFVSFNVSGFDAFDAPSSMCDKRTGDLLFYTEGRNVWDRTFKLMPNGRELRGGYAATQAALIVPFPESDHQYYLFTTRAVNDTFPTFPENYAVGFFYVLLINFNVFKS